MVDTPPIKNGPRLTREESIKLLVGLSFTRLEAIAFLDAKDRAERHEIHTQAMKRLKGEPK